MNFKKLLEKRNELVEQVNKMFETAEKENRAFNDEETTKYQALVKEIKGITDTINMYTESRKFESGKTGAPAAAADKRSGKGRIQSF